MVSMFPSVREAVDPFPFYARMRSKSPVCFDESIGCWAVFRYEDVKKVASEDGVFSRRPTLYAASKSTDNLITRSLHYEDPPEHTVSRDLLLPALSAKEQRRYEPIIKQALQESLSEALSRKDFDVIAHLSEPIAVKTIAAFLGVPESHHENLKRWMHSVTTVEVASPNWKETYIAREFVFEEISRYFQKMVEERLRNPGEDFVSKLLASKIGDQKFTEEKVAGNCTLLVLAMDVIKLFLGNVFYVLLKHPQIVEAIKSDGSLVPQVLEECFRYLGPTHAITRVAARDVEFDGRIIKTGQMIYAWLASANHDESVFENAETFNHERQDISNHIAFSGGAHACPGGPFIRIIGNEFLKGLIPKIEEYRLKDRPLERLPNYIFFGFKKLQVTSKKSNGGTKMERVKAQPEARPEVRDLDPYKLGNSLEETARLMGIKRLLRFGHNQNPIGPSPKAVAAIKQVLKNINIYPDIHTSALKKALAKHLKVSEENLVIGSGSNEIIRMAMDVFISPGDEVVMSVPEYPPYRIEAKRLGGKIREVKLKGDQTCDLEGLKQAVNGNTKMVVLTNPKYPTGTMVKQKDLDSFLSSLPENIVVLLDECYRDFVDEKGCPNGVQYVLEGFPVIVLRTLSKSYGLAGVRVGYAIASKEYVDFFHRVRPMYNVNVLAEMGAIAALSDKEHYKKTQKLIWKEKRYLYKEFKRMGIQYVPTQSNFLLFQVPGGDDMAFSRSLFPFGIMTVPGSWSGIPGWIPLTLRNHTDNAYFVKSVEKLLGKKG